MTFIICSRKKSMAKVSVFVCEKCPRKKRCPDYALYIQPTLFPKQREDKTTRTRKHLQKRKQEKSGHPSREEQLKLDF